MSFFIFGIFFFILAKTTSTVPKLNVSEPPIILTKRKIKKLKPKKSTQNTRNGSLFFFNFFRSKIPKTERTRERKGTQTMSGREKFLQPVI
jgi:hypothetical protein